MSKKKEMDGSATHRNAENVANVVPTTSSPEEVETSLNLQPAPTPVSASASILASKDEEEEETHDLSLTPSSTESPKNVSVGFNYR